MDLSIIKIDFGNETPIYQQLSGQLQALIDNCLKAGDYLPTETAFCEYFSISRSTVRQAFDILENNGSIVRMRRRGTRVCTPKSQRCVSGLYSFTAAMQRFGLTSTSKLLHFSVTKPTKYLAGILRIAPSQKVYEISRLRIVDEAPMRLETAYVPTVFCPNLSAEQLTGSLTGLISEHSGFLPQEAVETYEAVGLSEYEANILHMQVGAPAMRILRTSTNTNGNIYEHSHIITIGSSIQLALTNSSASVLGMRLFQPIEEQNAFNRDTGFGEALRQ